MNAERREAAADPQTKPSDLANTHFYRSTEGKKLGGWLHTEMFTRPQTVTHVGTNRV